jgi:hypothetical protein
VEWLEEGQLRNDALMQMFVLRIYDETMGIMACNYRRDGWVIGCEALGVVIYRDI